MKKLPALSSVARPAFPRPFHCEKCHALAGMDDIFIQEDHRNGLNGYMVGHAVCGKEIFCIWPEEEDHGQSSEEAKE